MPIFSTGKLSGRCFGLRRCFFNGYLRRVPGPTFSLDHEFRQDPGPPGGQAHVAMRPILLLLGGLASSLHPPCGRDQRAGDVVGRPYGPGKTETRSGLRLVGKIRSGVFQCKRFVDPGRQSGQAALLHSITLPLFCLAILFACIACVHYARTQVLNSGGQATSNPKGR